MLYFWAYKCRARASRLRRGLASLAIGLALCSNGSAATVVLGSASACGPSVELPLTLSEREIVRSVTFTVTYDPARLSYSDFDFAQSGWRMETISTAPGAVRLKISQVIARNVDSRVGSLRFAPVSSSSSGPIAVELSDVYWELLTASGPAAGTNASIDRNCPDLVITQIAATPNPVRQGGNMTVSFELRNQGTGIARGNVTTEVRLSNNDSPTADGILLKTTDLSLVDLGSGQQVSGQIQATVAPDPGTYHLKIVADSAGTVAEGGREDNNVAVWSTPIRIEAGTPVCEAPTANRIYIEWQAAETGCSSYHDPTQCPPRVNEVITFNAATFGYSLQACDRFVWDMGNGVQYSSARVSYTYAAPGVYQVVLKVENPSGSHSYVATINVRGAENQNFAMLLPVVAHLPGQGGSQWRSDLHVFIPDGALGPAPLELELSFAGLNKTLVIDQSTSIFEDLMGLLTDADNAGPVIVRGTNEHVPAMWSRTYNISPSGVGTFGQRIRAVPITPRSLEPRVISHFLPGLRIDSRYRTNLGLVNPNAITEEFTVKALDGFTGTPLGEFRISVAPFSLSQVNDLKLRVPGLPSVFTLVVTAGSANQVIAYASMVDNVSNDPVYIAADTNEDLSDQQREVQFLPGIGRVGTWRSDVTLFNPDDASVEIDLAFYDHNGTRIAETRGIALPAKTSLHVEDILSSPVFDTPGFDNTTGVLRIETRSPAVVYPMAHARTYSDQQSRGTYGQGIPAIPASEANVRSGVPSFIPAVRHDFSYRTNLGLVSFGEQSKVRVSVLNRFQNEIYDSRTLDLDPNQSVIVPNVFEWVGSAQGIGTLKVEIVSGAPVWAFASVIDRLTLDPEYVPAIPLN